MNVKPLLKKYRLFLLLLAVQAAVLLLRPDRGQAALAITGQNALEMLAVLPPIFVLLGLLDVWVKKETIIKYMGEGSRFVGVLLAFFLGSAAAGPLYGAFPVAAVLLRKGCKLSNVFILMGAWSTTKIPQLLFEVSAMGLPFTALRFGLNLLGIGAIAWITERSLSAADRDEMAERARSV